MAELTVQEVALEPMESFQILVTHPKPSLQDHLEQTPGETDCAKHQLATQNKQGW